MESQEMTVKRRSVLLGGYINGFGISKSVVYAHTA